MFGYVTIHKPELKFREFDYYRSYYCGLCHTLKSKADNFGRLSLTYDMTFLTLLLTSLYESEDEAVSRRCIVHPLQKHEERINEYTEYAADMNLLLTWYKCMDDWADDRDFFRLNYAAILQPQVRKIEQRYPQKAAVIREKLQFLSEFEKRNEQEVDLPSGLFGELTAEIFAYREDEWNDLLREMGFYLGKFIYLTDAYEDLEKDVKKNRYNPLAQFKDLPDYEEKCHQLLTMMMARCCQAFECLPIIENADILRNILYAGVWTRYRLTRQKKEESKND